MCRARTTPQGGWDLHLSAFRSLLRHPSYHVLLTADEAELGSSALLSPRKMVQEVMLRGHRPAGRLAAGGDDAVGVMLGLGMFRVVTITAAWGLGRTVRGVCVGRARHVHRSTIQSGHGMGRVRRATAGGVFRRACRMHWGRPGLLACDESGVCHIPVREVDVMHLPGGHACHLPSHLPPLPS